jgi:hypothetical protein
VERDAEVALLRGLYEDCIRGHGSVAVVRGEVAFGKTELLESLSEFAGQRGALVLGAAASPAEQSSACRWAWLGSSFMA